MLVTGFGSGLSPNAPGTAGTLVGLLILALYSLLDLPDISGLWGLIFLLLLTLASISLCNRALKARLFGQNVSDPQAIVIDEIAGYCVTVYGLVLNWKTLIGAFILFRIFDILKPPPVKTLERFPQGAGIVLDDILAGIYANITLRLIDIILG